MQKENLPLLPFLVIIRRLYRSCRPLLCRPRCHQVRYQRRRRSACPPHWSPPILPPHVAVASRQWKPSRGAFNVVRQPQLFHYLKGSRWFSSRFTPCAITATLTMTPAGVNHIVLLILGPHAWGLLARWKKEQRKWKYLVTIYFTIDFFFAYYLMVIQSHLCTSLEDIHMNCICIHENMLAAS
jgi:hypothetical protein